MRAAGVLGRHRRAERAGARLQRPQPAEQVGQRGLAEPGSDVPAGPAYRDRQIVIARGAKPVIVSKDFAYQSRELTARMNADAR